MGHPVKVAILLYVFTYSWVTWAATVCALRLTGTPKSSPPGFWIPDNHIIMVRYDLRPVFPISTPSSMTTVFYGTWFRLSSHNTPWYRSGGGGDFANFTSFSGTLTYGDDVYNREDVYDCLFGREKYAQPDPVTQFWRRPSSWWGVPIIIVMLKPPSIFQYYRLRRILVAFLY